MPKQSTSKWSPYHIMLNQTVRSIGLSGLLITGLIITTFGGSSIMANAATIEPGQKAPLFEATTHEGNPFRLADRKDHGWTVLYFYPKAETPGCTKQACAFRDAITKIHKLDAEVYGISADSVETQAAFHKHHGLKFTLLADPDSKVITAFDAKMPLLKMSKRWTFIIDPSLVIRHVEKDVDPAMDATHVADILKKLQEDDTQGKKK